jgi:hypothetical protein
MAEIHRLIFPMALAVFLGACSQEQLAPPRSHAMYSPDPAMVRKVQIALRDRGYYAGVIDGWLGQNTAIGIQRFQVDHDQLVKPVIDRSLLVSLGIARHGKYESITSLTK